MLYYIEKGVIVDLHAQPSLWNLADHTVVERLWY